MNKNILITIVLIIIVGAGAFYGGMQYEKSKQGTTGQYAMQGQGAGMRGGYGRRLGGQGGANGSAVRGKIISVSDTSITVQMMDGSSKIVLLGSSTPITKATAGTKTDLTAGAQVMAVGTTNSDGSVTAQFVQLNPVGMGMGRNRNPMPTQ